MGKLLLLLIIIFPTLGCRPASAQHAKADNIAVAGAGAYKCDRLNSSLKSGVNNDQVRFFMTYAQGQMSGINIVKLNSNEPYINLLAISPDEQISWLADYCLKNPDISFYLAVIKLYAHLSKHSSEANKIQ